MTAQRLVRVCTLPGFVDYEKALQLQRSLRDLRVKGRIPDTLLCLQHSPAYTVGKRGAADDFLMQPEQLIARGATVTHIERGGQVTFHGPGQWVCYPVYHLRDLGVGARTFIRSLEQSAIAAVGCWGLHAAGDAADAAGVWVGGEKVAAIGVHISRGVAIHGIALNVNTDLDWYRGIVPCGHRVRRVTTLQRLLGEAVPMDAARRHLVAQLTRRFGHTRAGEVAEADLLREGGGGGA